MLHHKADFQRHTGSYSSSFRREVANCCCTVLVAVIISLAELLASTVWMVTCTGFYSEVKHLPGLELPQSNLGLAVKGAAVSEEAGMANW